jgi:hypothetical protein
MCYASIGEAVHVIRQGALVKKLWRGSAVVQGDAYEAGLYTLRPSMFDVLEKLQVRYMYVYMYSHVYALQVCATCVRDMYTFACICTPSMRYIYALYVYFYMQMYSKYALHICAMYM